MIWTVVWFWWVLRFSGDQGSSDSSSLEASRVSSLSLSLTGFECPAFTCSTFNAFFYRRAWISSRVSICVISVGRCSLPAHSVASLSCMGAGISHATPRAWWPTPSSSALRPPKCRRKGGTTAGGGGTWAARAWRGTGPSPCPIRSLSGRSRPWPSTSFPTLLTVRRWCCSRDEGGLLDGGLIYLLRLPTRVRRRRRRRRRKSEFRKDLPAG